MLLVYEENLSPADLLALLKGNCFDEELHQLQYVYERLAVGSDGEWTIVGGNAGTGVNGQPFGKIEDAARFPVRQLPPPDRTQLYSEGHQQKLPRLLEFPASNASGVPNPFARMPAADWFGDVYS